MDARELTGRLILLDHLRRRRIRELTPPYDLSHGKLPVLEYIIRFPGCTQKEIADWFVQSPAAITQTTKKLEELLLIERRVERNDLRCNRLFVTAEGNKAALEYRQLLDKVDSEMCSDLSDADKEQFAALCDHMINSLNTENTEFSDPWKEK